MGYPTCAIRRWDFFIGASKHEGQIPPAPPVPMWHISFGIVSGTQLFAQPTNPKKKQVLSDGVHLMGRLSDAFPVVPHLTIPMGYQPMLPLTILFGSSTSCWGSGKVTLLTYNPIFGNSDADIATYVGFAFGPHLGCNEPFSAPLDVAFATNTTCQVGFSWGDFAACLIDIALQIALEVVLKLGGDAFSAMSRKLKASKTGAGKLAKLRKAKEALAVADTAVTKAEKDVAEHAASKAGKEAAEDSAAKKVSELDDAVDAGKKVAVDLSDEADEAVREADEVADALDKKLDEAIDAKSAAKKAVSEAETGAKKALTAQKKLEKELSSSNSKLTSLEEQASKIDEIYKDAPERLKIERQNAAAAIASEKKANQKLSQKLSDLKDASWSTIWKSQHKTAAEKAEEVANRSKYITWDDYLTIYGNVDSKALKKTKLYGLYKKATSSREFIETWAYHAGYNSVYLFVHRASAAAGKTFSRFYKASYASSSENKSIAWYSNVHWGAADFSRLDFIDLVNQDGGSDDSGEAATTGSRFAWVDDRAKAETITKSRFEWADADAATASDEHWADSSYVAGDDRFAWVDDLEGDSTDTTTSTDSTGSTGTTGSTGS